MANEEFGLGFTNESLALFNDFEQGKIGPSATLLLDTVSFNEVTPPATTFGDVVTFNEVTPPANLFSDIVVFDKISPQASLFSDVVVLDKIGPVVGGEGSGLCWAPNQLGFKTGPTGLYSRLSINPSGNQNNVVCRPFVPDPIPNSSPLIWMDGGDLDTFQLGTYPDIERWTSKGSVNYSPSQPDISLRPHVASGVNAGQSGVSFSNGINDHLAAYINLPKTFGEVWHVTRYDGNTGSSQVLLSYTDYATNTPDFFWVRATAGPDIFYQEDGAQTLWFPTNAGAAGELVLTRIFKAGPNSIWTGQSWCLSNGGFQEGMTRSFGATVPTYWYGRTDNLNNFQLGVAKRAGFFGQCWQTLFEVLIFDRHLADEEASDIATHLINKWNIL